MASRNDPAIQSPFDNVVDEDILMELFDQFSGLKSPVLDWLEMDTTVTVSEASLQGKSATYQVTIQNLVTTALLDARANISDVMEKFFKSLPQTPQLLKVCTH